MRIWGLLSLLGLAATVAINAWSFAPGTYSPDVGDNAFAALVMGTIAAILAMGLSKLVGFGPLPLPDEQRGPIGAIRSVPVWLTLLLAAALAYAGVIWSTTKWSTITFTVGQPFEVIGPHPKIPNQRVRRLLTPEEYNQLSAINIRVGSALLMPMYVLPACFFFARAERRRRRPDEVAAQLQPATVEAADRINLSQFDRWSDSARSDTNRHK